MGFSEVRFTPITVPAATATIATSPTSIKLFFVFIDHQNRLWSLNIYKRSENVRETPNNRTPKSGKYLRGVESFLKR
jgi:hypothetical protein